MRAIIIDDELMAIELMEVLLGGFEEVELVGSFTNPNMALDEFEALDVDVVFLDIEMGSVSGIEFAESLLQIKEDLEIVFVTAYYQYAIEAFELNVIDYLLKPVEIDRLEKTIKRLEVKRSLDREESQESSPLWLVSFGSFGLFNNQGRPVKWRTQKSRELLAYLWYRKNEPVKKTWILDDVFTDRDINKATTLLHTTIYQLRQVLRKQGYTDPIAYANDSYMLNINLDSDLDRFKELINKKSLSDAEIEEILLIYRDDFLGHEGYLWSLASQKSLQDRFLTFLINCTEKRLMANSPDPLLEKCLNKLYSLDPFDEKVMKLHMHYHFNTGGSSQLENFYARHKKLCMDDMNMEPSKELEALYRKLKAV